MASRMLVFVRGKDEGPILDVSGEDFTEEIAQSGSDICNHDIEKPPRQGLLVFEGWVEVSGGEDPDVLFVGGWRELTHWEMCKVRCGETPFT